MNSCTKLDKTKQKNPLRWTLSSKVLIIEAVVQYGFHSLVFGYQPRFIEKPALGGIQIPSNRNISFDGSLGHLVHRR